MTPARDDVAEVRRHLAAAPDLVFAAFADPALVRRWLTPSSDVRLDVPSFDFRVGGAYRFAYHVPGGAIMHVNGVFHTIERPLRIVFSWNIEAPDEHAGAHSEVQVAIEPDGDGSQLHIRHVRLARSGAPERHAEGWRGATERLAALLKERAHGG